MPTKPISYAYIANRIFPTMVTKFVSFVCEQNLILKPTLLIHVSCCVKRSCLCDMRAKTAFYAYIIGQLFYYASKNSSVGMRGKTLLYVCVTNQVFLTVLTKTAPVIYERDILSDFSLLS